MIRYLFSFFFIICQLSCDAQLAFPFNDFYQDASLINSKKIKTITSNDCNGRIKYKRSYDEQGRLKSLVMFYYDDFYNKDSTIGYTEREHFYKASKIDFINEYEDGKLLLTEHYTYSDKGEIIEEIHSVNGDTTYIDRLIYLGDRDSVNLKINLYKRQIISRGDTLQSHRVDIVPKDTLGIILTKREYFSEEKLTRIEVYHLDNMICSLQVQENSKIIHTWNYNSSGQLISEVRASINEPKDRKDLNNFLPDGRTIVYEYLESYPISAQYFSGGICGTIFRMKISEDLGLPALYWETHCRQPELKLNCLTFSYEFW